jgi:hypothetical protein
VIDTRDREDSDTLAKDKFVLGILVDLLSRHRHQIKNVEQVGAGQPATRPESKPEGNDKPKPESEGRSR